MTCVKKGKYIKNAIISDPLIKNSIYLMLSTIFGASSGFIFWYIGAKFYSEENVGLVAAITSIMGLISLFSRCGLDIGIVRYLANEKDKNGMINSCLTIISITSVILTFIFLLGIKVFSPRLLFIRSNLLLSTSLIVFTMANSLFLTQSNIFASLRRARYSLIQTIIATFRMFIIPLLTSWGMMGIYLSYGLGPLLACICGNLFIYKVHSSYKPALIIKRKILNEIFLYSFGNYIATIFEGFPTFLLPVVVINILGAEQNAYFYMAWSISGILLMVPKATSMSLFAEGANCTKNYNNKFLKAVSFVIIIQGSLLFLTYIFGRDILFFFGPSYAESAAEILWLFSVASVPYSIIVFYVTLKRVQKKLVEVVLVYAFIGLFSIIGGYILMHEYGLRGVAISWIIANTIPAIIILITQYISQRHIGK